MANESSIVIKLLLTSREDYEKYGPYILGLKNMERNMKTMVNFIKQFYDSYPKATEITQEEFNLFLKNNDTYNFAGNNKEYINGVFNTSLANKDLKLDVVEAVIERHITSRVLDKVALVLDNNQTGVLSKIQNDIDEYHSIIRNPPKDISEYKLDLNALIKTEITNIGLPFINTKPNDVIRGMREGQLGFIYAYVDTGKTSYGVANLCSVAQSLEAVKSPRPAIYGCNEEDVSRVTLRAIQCMTNWTDTEIEKNQKHVQNVLDAKGFNRIRFIDHVTNMRVVEKILIKYDPRVFFIDLGTKVKVTGSKAEGVSALEETFNNLRDLAKRYRCTIVAMGQGGDDCFEKKYPTLRDIYGSKSAVQGELDWAISIGVDASDPNYEGFRYFSITKNKGDKATYECRFDHKRCQFSEV